MQKKLQNCVSVFIVLVLVMVLSSCSTNGPAQSDPQEPQGSQSSQDTQNSQDNSAASARIAVITQEYQGDNIAEILNIAYDGENAAIDSINNDIRNGILREYDEFMAKSENENWIEIRSYPFTSDDYLQIVMTHVEYPIYGTDGEIWSYNFNRKENRSISVEEMISELALTPDSLAQQVKDIYVPGSPSESVGEVQAKGFLVHPDGRASLLLQVVIENPEASSWDTFFSFTPLTGELLKLDKMCLFDPNDMDKMDPPLAYDQNTPAEIIGEETVEE